MGLWKAVQAGDSEEIHRLLDQGADPNEADCEGVTLLMRAAVRGDVSVAAALLDRGADIDRVDEGASTALLHTKTTGTPSYALSNPTSPDVRVL